MSKKEKLLAEAQKLFQKGQLDKAIKGYQEALALDPADQRVRQRLAEMLIKANRLEEARTELVSVGKALATSGFFLKAIAVYKQIEKLFPDDVSTTLTLASLNEQHGLMAQAMAEYKKAFQYYEQQSNMAEAVKVLQLMQKADALNVNIRLKLAEVLYQLGRLDDSFETFTALAGLVVERREEASFHRLIQRIGQLFPEKNDVACTVIEHQIELGNGEQAAQLLHSLLRSDPHQRWVWQSLVMAYERMGNWAKLKATSLHFIKFFPNEVAPREQLIRCLLAEQDTAGVLEQLEMAEPLFVAANAASTLKELYLELEKLLPIDVRVMKGLIRAFRACGEEDAAEKYSAKISSLAALSGARAEQSVPLAPVDTATVDRGPAVEPVLEQEPEPAAVALDMQSAVVVSGDEPAKTDAVLYDIEIELDLDEEPPYTPAAQAVSSENWFETVSDIFDTIATGPGTVKIGDGLESGDSQSHFDLGLAFREMGLLDEAINEFKLAGEDPERRVECLIQQASCLRDKGELTLAENALKSLLTAPELTVEEISAIKYEWALTCEASGHASEAARLYGEIEEMNPAFRDVQARLQQPDGGAATFDFDEDDLLDFELK